MPVGRVGVVGTLTRPVGRVGLLGTLTCPCGGWVSREGARPY